jgi:hypothetical protein
VRIRLLTLSLVDDNDNVMIDVQYSRQTTKVSIRWHLAIEFIQSCDHVDETKSVDSILNGSGVLAFLKN